MPAYRLTLLLLISTFTLLACDKTPSESSNEKLVPLNHLPALHGDYFKFDSAAVGRAFHIYVRLPEGYDSSGDTDYPVVYLLDGDSLFPILAANHLFLSYDDKLPEAIVVGIAYGGFDPAINKRHIDFTPGEADGMPGEGGAAAFHQFLQHELLPTIESRYQADANKRVLFGQSRGGSMVLYSAFTEPDLFWGRIASNPAFQPVIEFFYTRPASASRNDLHLMVTSGSADRPQLIADAKAWFGHWQDRDDLPWQLELKVIAGGTHASDSPGSYRAGMRWLFQLADEQ